MRRDSIKRTKWRHVFCINMNGRSLPNQINSHHNATAVRFPKPFVHLGQRLGEIVNLTWDRIDLQRGFITLRSIDTKTNLRRAGVDTATAMRIVGHKSEKMWKRYNVMWPGLRITKGDLMRYYIGVAPFLLPVIRDRPLTYRPYRQGVNGRPDRYHQRVQHEVPDGVRVESLKGIDKDYEPRFIGGSLLTLLYMVQYDIISQDPWLSTVQAADYPDLAVIDLDPAPHVPFETGGDNRPLAA